MTQTATDDDVEDEVPLTVTERMTATTTATATGVATVPNENSNSNSSNSNSNNSTRTTAIWKTRTTNTVFGKDLLHKPVQTNYGPGIVEAYREATDQMYAIRLISKEELERLKSSTAGDDDSLFHSKEFLTTMKSTSGSGNAVSSSSRVSLLYTPQTPIRIKTVQDERDEFNVAYEALEKMRRLNLEMECFEHGIAKVDYEECATCLLSSQPHPPHSSIPQPEARDLISSTSSTAAATVSLGSSQRQAKTKTKNHFPRLQLFVDSAKATAEQASASTKNGSSFPRLRKLGLFGSTTTTTTPSSTAAPSSSARVPSAPATRVASREVGSSTPPEPTPTPTSTSNDAASAEIFSQTPSPPSAASADTKPAAAHPSSKSSSTVVLPRIQKFLDSRQKAAISPCLICASPACRTHSSTSFRKEGIVVCNKCERLFELDFIVDCVSTPDAAERRRRIDHMMDCYDRCLLLLHYSVQYAELIAQNLEAQTHQHHKIGLGGSGVGVVSGVLGIAAAATILTPAGPPLLIASLFFGGGATAVQTGSDAYRYLSEPNQLADRILALHGMVLSLLRVTSTLRDAMLRDYIRTDAMIVCGADGTTNSDTTMLPPISSKAGVLAASNVGRAATLGSVAGAEGAIVASGGAVVTAEAAAGAGARGATALSRAGTAAARTVRLARFAGGALSAAVLVMEANAIHSTIREIHNGSPCDKAERIRAIALELQQEDVLPTTAELDEECQAYLVALANRPPPPVEVVAASAINTTNTNSDEDFPQAECAVAPLIMTAPMRTNMHATTDEDDTDGALIVQGTEEDAGATATAVATPASNSQANPTSRSASSSFWGGSASVMGSSLVQRFQDLSLSVQPSGLSQNNTHDRSEGDEVMAAVAEDGRHVGGSTLDLVV